MKSEIKKTKTKNIYIDCIEEGLVEVKPLQMAYLSQAKDKVLKIYPSAKSVFALPYDGEDKRNFIKLYFSKETVEELNNKITH